MLGPNSYRGPLNRSMRRDVGRGMQQARRMPLEEEKMIGEARPIMTAQMQQTGPRATQMSAPPPPPPPTIAPAGTPVGTSGTPRGAGGAVSRVGFQKNAPAGAWQSSPATSVQGGVDPRPFQEQQNEALMEAFNQLLNPIDTKAQEQRAVEMYQQRLGNQLNDARARMGALGFEASGAQLGLEGDIQQRAADAAMDEILGIQRSAQDQYASNVGKAAGIANQMQGTALDDMIVQAILDQFVEHGGGGAAPSGLDPNSNLGAFLGAVGRSTTNPLDALSQFFGGGDDVGLVSTDPGGIPSGSTLVEDYGNGMVRVRLPDGREKDISKSAWEASNGGS